MVYYIRELFCDKASAEFEFMNDYNRNFYESQISDLNSGGVLRKTTENNPVAINFFLSVKKSKSLFFFYDSAGEAFANTQHLSQHNFYDYFHGLIFVIDPFSIPDVYHDYKRLIDANPEIRPSTYPLEDVYDASLINLEKNYGLKVTEKVTKPVAIIISKVDAFDLQDRIGQNAVKKLMASDPTIKTEQDAMNKLCKDFLKEYQMEALLRKLEWKFPNSNFFAISSQGKNSIGIDNATDWLLKKVNSSLKS